MNPFLVVLSSCSIDNIYVGDDLHTCFRFIGVKTFVRQMEFSREMLKDQVHLCKIKFFLR
jgi:hypothetical protein